METNLISLLPGVASTDELAIGNSKSLDGDNDFENILKEATQKPKPEPAPKKEPPPREKVSRQTSSAAEREPKTEQAEDPPAKQTEPLQEDKVIEKDPPQEKAVKDTETPDSQEERPTEVAKDNVAVAEEQEESKESTQTKINTYVDFLQVEVEGESEEQLFQVATNLNPYKTLGENNQAGEDAAPSDLNTQLGATALTLNTGAEESNTGAIVEGAKSAAQIKAQVDDLNSKTLSEKILTTTKEQSSQQALLAGEDGASDETRLSSSSSEILKLKGGGEKPLDSRQFLNLLSSNFSREATLTLDNDALGKETALPQNRETNLLNGGISSSLLEMLGSPDKNSSLATKAVNSTDNSSTQNVALAGNKPAQSVEGTKSTLQEILTPRGSTEKNVLEQIIQKFTIRGTGSQKEVNIRLEPPSLGTVRMNVSTSGESVKTTIITENHMVKQIIENNLAQLRDSMTHQGLKVDSFQVFVGGDTGPGQGDPRQDFIPAPSFKELEDLEPQENGVSDGPVASNHASAFFGEHQSLSVFA